VRAVQAKAFTHKSVKWVLSAQRRDVLLRKHGYAVQQVGGSAFCFWPSGVSCHAGRLFFNLLQNEALERSCGKLAMCWATM